MNNFVIGHTYIADSVFFKKSKNNEQNNVSLVIVKLLIRLRFQ